MNTATVLTILQGGIVQVIKLAGPVLVAALLVGLVIALIQAITSIQEQTLSFVPKVLAILGMIALLGGWMLSSMQEYTVLLFKMIPDLVK